MTQKIIVAILFAGALYWIVRYLFRKYLTDNQDGNSCDNCGVG